MSGNIEMSKSDCGEWGSTLYKFTKNKWTVHIQWITLWDVIYLLTLKKKQFENLQIN